MLTYLNISNYKLIDRLETEFSPGLNVLTGETGAGKSIILGALTTLLSGPAGSDFFRDRELPVVISAAFSPPASSRLRHQLEELGLAGDDNEIIFRRQITINRRGGLNNRVYLNDQPATNRTVAELAANLLEFVDQHQQQKLRDSRTALLLLDAFGDLQAMRDEFNTHFRRFREEERKLEDWRQQLREAARQMDYHLHQLTELEEAELDPQVELDLQARRRRLQQQEKLQGLAREAERLNYSGENSLLDNCYRLQELCDELHRRDESAPDCSESLVQVIDTLQEIHTSIDNYRKGLESGDDTIDEIENRLAVFERLKRKFATDIEGLIELRNEIAAKVSGWENRDQEDARRSRELEELRDRAETAARNLSRARAEQAARLTAAVNRHLQELNLPQARFAVEITTTAWQASGADRVTFRFSANPGETPAPLERTASGGELSRLLLALKTAVAGQYRIPTLVFDEIDTGLGGKTAAAVGRKLAAIATGHQVFSITHLPQVAAFADHHYVITKELEATDSSTRIRLHRIDPDNKRERIRELARMGSGDEITPESEAHARTLFETARKEQSQS
ncbi:MAG: DNA repair protein RecN [Deltaproteobacteria bacterium]|nr:DNA repair protein RecN [Deltaproteobacteria bacterium]